MKNKNSVFEKEKKKIAKYFNKIGHLEAFSKNEFKEFKNLCKKIRKEAPKDKKEKFDFDWALATSIAVAQGSTIDVLLNPLSEQLKRKNSKQIEKILEGDYRGMNEEIIHKTSEDEEFREISSIDDIVSLLKRIVVNETAATKELAKSAECDIRESMEEILKNYKVPTEYTDRIISWIEERIREKVRTNFVDPEDFSREELTTGEQEYVIERLTEFWTRLYIYLACIEARSPPAIT